MFRGILIQPILVAVIFVSFIFGGFSVFADDNILFNNGSRFLRSSSNNEIVLGVENGTPHYASKVLLVSKQDNVMEKWQYDEATKQIYGVNNFCLGVGGEYEIMLKDCVETLVNTIWHFDEIGRLVGVINVRGNFEAKCAEAIAKENRQEMMFVSCNDQSNQKYELEGTKKTMAIEEIILLAKGKSRDSVYNEITNNQDLEELEKAVYVLGMEENLRGGEITILAPSDQAFENLGDKVSEKIRNPENKEILNQILQNHIVNGLYGYNHIASMDKLINTSGNEIDIDLENQSLIEGDTNIVTKDWAGRNGIVHVIDKVLLPASVDLNNLK